MSALEQAFREHRELLWGVAYRMVGTACEADDIVQETFARALVHRPSSDRPLRPWLVRVAANLSRDRLRRRRRRAHEGPWLPAPVADDPLQARQEATYAWLVAAEALTPSQRAVLVLRDVAELTGQETAEALGMSVSNVKVTLHRARRALARADGEVLASDEAVRVVQALLAALGRGSVDEAVALLAPDVVAIQDGGGRFHAARRPVVGADRVLRLFRGLYAKNLPRIVGFDLQVMGGLPALVVQLSDEVPAGFASRSITLFGVDRGGRVARLYGVLDDRKLGRGLDLLASPGGC